MPSVKCPPPTSQSTAQCAPNVPVHRATYLCGHARVAVCLGGGFLPPSARQSLNTLSTGTAFGFTNVFWPFSNHDVL